MLGGNNMKDFGGGGFRGGGDRHEGGGFRGGSGGGFRDNFANREMHKATCSECSNECEVPFEPKEGRPVYCRDCYSKRKRF